MKKLKITQFPNIYRFITENKLFKKLLKTDFRLLNQSKHNKLLAYFLSFIALLTTILLLLTISILIIKFYQEVKLYSEIAGERQAIQQKINFWQSFTQKYDGYKDAYFQIALLEYNLGNFRKAKEYNRQALLLDPGFSDAKNLQILLKDK